MRRLLLPILFVFFTAAASAQVGELRNNIAVGFGGGYNLSRVDFSPTIKQGLLPGYMGGFTLRYTTEKYFSIICAAQLEVNYAQRGWVETIDDGSDNTYSRTTHYVEVPFFAHLGGGNEQRGLQFFVNAGPQFGLYLGGSEHYGFTSDKPWNPTLRPNNVTAQYGKEVENALEYGIAGGAGMELKTSVGNFIVEGRYFYGLSDMFGNAKADPFGRSANTTITAKISYLIDICK